MLQEEISGLAGPDGKVLLNLLALAAAKGRIGQDDIEAVFLLDIRDVLGQRVGVDDVGRLDAMQDHVHDGNHIGQAFFLLAVEGSFLQDLKLAGGELAAIPWVAQIRMGLAQEPCRTHGAIINALANLWFDNLDHGANQGARRIVFATVAPGVAHVLDLGLIQMGEFMALLLGAEAQGIHQLQHLAQVVAALEPVSDLVEYLANLVFNGVWTGSLVPEALKIGKKIVVDVVDEIIAA